MKANRSPVVNSIDQLPPVSQWEARFWDSAKRGEGCWEGVGAKGTRGYGDFYIPRKGYRAHRIAYLLTHGTVEVGLLVCHTCDNPSCVNPDHLWTGTQKENMQDAKSKGRIYSLADWANNTGNKNRGENNPSARLTPGQVQEIRQMATAGIGPNRIMSAFKISRSQVYRIVNWHQWTAALARRAPGQEASDG